MESVCCFLFNTQCYFKSAHKFGHVGFPAAPSPELSDSGRVDS